MPRIKPERHGPAVVVRTLTQVETDPVVRSSPTVARATAVASVAEDVRAQDRDLLSRLTPERLVEQYHGPLAGVAAPALDLGRRENRRDEPGNGSGVELTGRAECGEDAEVENRGS